MWQQQQPTRTNSDVGTRAIKQYNLSAFFLYFSLLLFFSFPFFSSFFYFISFYFLRHVLWSSILMWQRNIYIYRRRCWLNFYQSKQIKWCVALSHSQRRHSAAFVALCMKLWFDKTKRVGQTDRERVGDREPCHMAYVFAAQSSATSISIYILEEIQ